MMSHIKLVIEIVLEKATQEPGVHSSCCSPESNAAHNIPMDIVNGIDMAIEVAADCSDVDDSSSDTSECSMEIDDTRDNAMEIDDDWGISEKHSPVMAPLDLESEKPEEKSDETTSSV